MSLPWPVLWLIDPAGAYWARREPKLRGPVFTGGAVFGPDVPGGSRQATDDEIAAMGRDVSEEIARYERDLQAAARRWAPELRAAAAQLVADGTAGLTLDGTEVEARTVRFWRGDSLLEIGFRTAAGEGESRTRIPRHPQPDLLTDYLARAAAKG